MKKVTLFHIDEKKWAMILLKEKTAPFLIYILVSSFTRKHVYDKHEFMFCAKNKDWWYYQHVHLGL